ncbi:MAG: hypothetical protein JWL96_1456 [Sphingomonas bacterium]|uniref:hypothetical protein n=1 Tax=Sphingomonas bacterium TaxID=1895847 RepID=UPI0026206D2A|nr:hypothetical protein [Sphingomonas bacterium]MDB5709386.1 hypothetical protein [Sphingomonas bacterium]
MSVYRPAFEAALRAFARASDRMVAAGHERPVLVGGGAVELYSGSAINTGDFDVVTGRQDAFEAALAAEGFIRPIGPGHTSLGWIHPDLQLGFEVVGTTLLDGMADRDRVVLIDFGKEGRAAIIAVEDIIADRVGQFASGSAPAMLEQARRLLVLHKDVDLDYMERRIRHESAGEYGIAILRS